MRLRAFAISDEVSFLEGCSDYQSPLRFFFVSFLVLSLSFPSRCAYGFCIASSLNTTLGGVRLFPTQGDVGC